MSQNHSNKPRTQILDLVDESSQSSVLSQSNLQFIKGGLITMDWMTISEACSCTAGGSDFDNAQFYFL
jgi:hypothetical protein